MQPYILEEHEEGILVFTINRAARRNAIDYEIMAGLEEAIESSKMANIKALVITGSGNQAFCSGGDLSVFHQLITEEAAFGMLSKMSRILYRLLTLPKPTIALMNGTAVGGGCELATACDFRIARKNIKAGFVQGKLAITTGWGGGTILLEKLVYPNAMKMLLEAKIYDCEELQRLGFIDSVYEGDPLVEVKEYLHNIFQIDGSVLESYKRMAIRKWEEARLFPRIEEEVKKCAVLWESEAHHEQVNTFMNRK